MTQQLTKLIERVKTWPAWRQHDVARMIEAMEESGTEVYRLSDEERLLVDEGLDQANRGQFVSDDDMEKFWNRHRV
jgi:predicted transcriptional regulator